MCSSKGKHQIFNNYFLRLQTTDKWTFLELKTEEMRSLHVKSNVTRQPVLLQEPHKCGKKSDPL